MQLKMCGIVENVEKPLRRFSSFQNSALSEQHRLSSLNDRTAEIIF